MVISLSCLFQGHVEIHSGGPLHGGPSIRFTPPQGTPTRQRWQENAGWVVSSQSTHEALVDEVTWQRVQELMGHSTRGRSDAAFSRTTSPRSSPGRYPLVGLIQCGHCGKKLQGNHSRGLAFYRCRVSAGYPNVPRGHPPSLAVRQDRPLPHLDKWLSQLFDPRGISEAAAAVVAADIAANREAPQ